MGNIVRKTGPNMTGKQREKRKRERENPEPTMAGRLHGAALFTQMPPNRALVAGRAPIVPGAKVPGKTNKVLSKDSFTEAFGDGYYSKIKAALEDPSVRHLPALEQIAVNLEKGVDVDFSAELYESVLSGLKVLRSMDSGLVELWARLYYADDVEASLPHGLFPLAEDFEEYVEFLKSPEKPKSALSERLQLLTRTPVKSRLIFESLERFLEKVAVTM